MDESTEKPKVMAVRDLLNSLVAMHPGGDEEDVMIRLAMAVALDAVESYLYEGKYTPSVVPVSDKDGFAVASSMTHFLTEEEQDLLRARQASVALNALEARVVSFGKTRDELREICQKFVLGQGIPIRVDDQIKSVLGEHHSSVNKLGAARLMCDRYPLSHKQAVQCLDEYIEAMPRPLPTLAADLTVDVDDDDIPF